MGGCYIFIVSGFVYNFQFLKSTSCLCERPVVARAEGGRPGERQAWLLRAGLGAD